MEKRQLEAYVKMMSSRLTLAKKKLDVLAKQVNFTDTKMDILIQLQFRIELNNEIQMCQKLIDNANIFINDWRS